MSELQPSFSRIDYSVRPNKNIERKLVFDALVRIHAAMPVGGHRYVGFGSMWFGDFLLAHRILGLDDMWSIEEEEHAPRAAFNQPYRSITIKPGHSTDVLRAMTDEDWHKPAIFWLDYDGSLKDDVVNDIGLITARASVTSMLIVTVNANRKTYARPQGKLARTTIESIMGANMLASEYIAPNGQPLPATSDVEVKDFPPFLAESMLNLMKHRATTSGRTEGGAGFRFEPLFNFCHVDGAEMVTVGGALLTDALVADVRAAVADLLPLEAHSGYPQHRRLDLPQLTLREKIALDRVLPHSMAEFLGAAAAAGLCLPESALLRYRECCRHFPVFGEMYL